MVEHNDTRYAGAVVAWSISDSGLWGTTRRRQRKIDQRAQQTRSSSGFLVHQYLIMVYIIQMMASGIETSVSRDVAVAEGQPVILKCSSNRPAAWIAYDPGSSARQYVSTSASTLPSYRLLHDSSDQYDLSFNATKSFGKRYVCIEEASGNTILDFDVTVLDAKPNCILATDEHHINASCNINFAGNWAPTTEWEWWDGDNISTVGNSEINVIPRVSVTSIVSTSKICLSQCRWQCVIKFTESGRPSQSPGTNVPDYNYTWSSRWISPGVDPTMMIKKTKCRTSLNRRQCCLVLNVQGECFARP